MPNTRSELSEKNPYHIHKERYMELKHFCAQIPVYHARLQMLQRMRLYSAYPQTDFTKIYANTNEPVRPVEILGPSEEEQDLAHRIEIFSYAMGQAFPAEYSQLNLQFYQAVVGSVSYDKLCAVDPKMIVITREKWYECYRKFFYILDQYRH